MTWQTLHAPLYVPPGQREFSGRFKLAPDFKLGLRDGPGGWTSYGAIGIVGACGLRIAELEIDASALDFASTDWRVNQVRGLMIADSSGIVMEHFRAFRTVRSAIKIVRTQGFQARDLRATECHSLLDIAHDGYQDDPGKYRFQPRACRDFWVKDYEHRNGRNALPAGNPYYSLLRKGESFGGDGVMATGLIDSAFEDGSQVGETFGVGMKLMACSRVTVRRFVGASLQSQGCVGWSAAGVAPSQPYWPCDVPAVGEDLTFEDCVLNPRLSLVRFYDTVQFGQNAVHLNYPQKRTRILRGHLWQEPGSPVCVGAFEGPEVEIRGVAFHGVSGPEDPQAVFVYDSTSEWKTKLNDDWRTANEWRPE